MKDHAAFPPRAFARLQLLSLLVVALAFAAVTMPAVDSATAKASSARSIDNLRRLGQAYIAFAEDHDGRIPPAACEAPNPSPFGDFAMGKSWDYWLLPYLDYSAGDGFGDLTDANCPAAGELLAHPLDQERNRLLRTYAANRFVTPAVADAAAPWTVLPDLKHPGRLILLSERPYANGRIGRAQAAELSPGRQIAATQGRPAINPEGKYNYLFADGHVETLALEQTYRAGDAYPAEGGPAPGEGTGPANLWQPAAGASGCSMMAGHGGSGGCDHAAMEENSGAASGGNGSTEPSAAGGGCICGDNCSM